MRICAYRFEQPVPADRSAARRALVRALLAERPVDSQEELRRALARQGHRVSQTTVSRDLAAIGARKRPDGGYSLRRRGDDETLATVAERMRLFVLSLEASGNLAVLKTPPGSAHSVAVALDSLPAGALPELLGTLAGDDTMFVAARPPHDGDALVARLNSIMERGQ